MSTLLDKAIEKARELPEPEQDIDAAFEEMRSDPYSGDIKFLKGADRTLRRRVGAWRILFEVRADREIVLILAVERRSSATY